MTFTRLSDAATLYPLHVEGPLEHEREVRNITRELLHSASTRTTFVPAAPPSGHYLLRFTTHEEAKAGAVFFAQASVYGFAPDIINPGGWGWVDGYYVNTDPEPDESFDATFVVRGEEALRITQRVGSWHLVVPYKEVPA